MSPNAVIVSRSCLNRSGDVNQSLRFGRDGVWYALTPSRGETYNPRAMHTYRTLPGIQSTAASPPYGRLLCLLALLVPLAACSCTDGFRWGGGGRPVDTEAMAMLLPTKIKIHSFTKIKPLFGSSLPNGIEVWLEPLDRFNDVVKIVGELHFELYTYRQASANRKGEQIEFWQVRIGSPGEQQRYWDRVARMYQFPLGWDYAPPPGKKYVLLVTYLSPSDERLTDELELRFDIDRDQIMESFGKPDES
jgi:hypothetical protein